MVRDPALVRVLRDDSRLSGADAARILVGMVFGPPFGLILLFILPGLLADNPITDPWNLLMYLVLLGLIGILVVWPASEFVLIIAWVAGEVRGDDGEPSSDDGEESEAASGGIEYGLDHDRE